MRIRVSFIGLFLGVRRLREKGERGGKKSRGTKDTGRDAGPRKSLMGEDVEMRVRRPTCALAGLLAHCVFCPLSFSLRAAHSPSQGWVVLEILIKDFSLGHHMMVCGTWISLSSTRGQGKLHSRGGRIEGEFLGVQREKKEQQCGLRTRRGFSGAAILNSLLVGLPPVQRA